MEHPFTHQPADDIVYLGIETERLARWRASGLDDAGDPPRPFVDDEGGWPLRCCLRDSIVGAELAIVAASPFPWGGAYATRGPVVIHAGECSGADGAFPQQFEDRLQVVRAYGDDGQRARTLIYDLNQIVTPGSGLQNTIRSMLRDERVHFVQAYNVRAGCYSFTARTRQ